MSEQELNSYRFVSGMEPTDDMLSQIMSEVAAEARIRRQKASDTYFSQMQVNAAAKAKKWEDRINRALNG